VTPTTQTRTALKSIAEAVRRWPSDEAKEWAQSFILQACSHPSVLAVVAFGAAVRTNCFTADVDLLVIYERPKPRIEGRPIDVDIRWYERSQAERFIQEGQELLGWVVRFGELICERKDYWTKIRQEWLDRMPFPSAVVADGRVERAWRLYQELNEMGDEDAAQEQRLVALTQEARAKLIRQGVYPASRPELPDQLRGINERALAEKLEQALREREET
jgi:predicted nucleotidyltransferase